MEKLQSQKNIESALESILFAQGDAVEREAICTALELSDETVRAAAENLKARYEALDAGIRLIEVGECYQLCTSSKNYPYIQQLTQTKRAAGLSSAALETLSIVAYNQPVTKGTIEYIRGVDCTYSITRLAERGFIEELGRAETPGRPILYGTTLEFLRCFGLKTLEDLPPLPEKEAVTDEVPPPPDVVEALAQENEEG